jgi:peptidoglycan/xylan/chitin deacetylase (PgdA/CDA1 family)
VSQEPFSDYASFFSTGIIMALSWSQLSEMCSSRLCSIGSHTVSHPVLTKIPENRLDYEIVGSKNILEQKLNIPIEHFSYPHSFWNKQIKQKVQQAGYKTAVLGYGGSCRFNKTDNFLLPRNYILEK